MSQRIDQGPNVLRFTWLQPGFIILMALLSGAALSGLFLWLTPRVQAKEAKENLAMNFEDQPYLSEVAPVDGPGHPAWVELTVGRVDLDPHHIFLPLVEQGASQSLQSFSNDQKTSPQVTGLSMAGWVISDQDGNDYEFPSELTDLPKGTIVLVYLDGLGQAGDDLDASDGKVVLHTPPGLEDIFDGEGDQLALFDDTDTILDFFAWGQDPAGDEAPAVQASLWTSGTFMIFDPGFGAGGSNVPPAPDFSFGIWYEKPEDGYKNWVPYSAGHSTPGALNPPPPPLNASLPDGAEIGSEGFSLYWMGVPGAPQYEVDLFSEGNGAAAPSKAEVLQVQKFLVTEPNWKPDITLPDGVYSYTIKTISENGNSSGELGPFKLDLQALDDFIQVIPPVLLLDPSEYKIQHKDSPMLDIGGGPNNVVGANNAGDRRFPVDRRWDGEHQDDNGNPRFGWNGIDNWYCVRASTAMMADYYGGQLSQDRLSYYMFEEWAGSGAPMQVAPEHDLGFGTGIGSYSGQNEILSWALGTPINGISYCPPNPNDGKPYVCPDANAAPITWTQIKTWIDAGQPFASVNLRNAHMRVVDGYWDISTNSRWVHVLDPVPADTNACPTCPGARWESYTTFSNTHERAYPGPAGRNSAPGVLSDEASIWQDSDGDGISNFDEVNRFNTDPYNPDTDGDWVDDKNDMAEYVFDDDMAVGTYIYTPGMLPNTSDFDFDYKRKELDWDNDNDGSPDGCEDANGDGIFDALNDTSNFDPVSNQVCQPRFSIIDPVGGQAANAGDPADPGKVLIRLDVSLPPALPSKPTFSAPQFSATIGGLPATTISGIQIGQEFWLLVQAPVQASASFFDLQVDFDGTLTGHYNQSDLESNAVYYIPRPPMDTMVVVDTSGSMGLANRLPDAKNAARLFIDQWAEGDMIGLVSFASTGTLVSPLSAIGADLQVMTDTKTLVNGLTAGGSTAMGKGLKIGQGQLSLNGDASHDQSMMLLTDGEENVAPFWADPTVSGVIIPSKTVVHTIGFSQPDEAYLGLLAQIAGLTGGKFGAVSDPNLLKPDLLQTFPLSTANGLANLYKHAAEQILGEQRIYEASGVISPTHLSEPYRFPVGDVPSLLIGANFNLANQLTLEVFDPDGKQVMADDLGVAHRLDPTHEQYRIPAPKPGFWEAVVSAKLPRPENSEYLLFVSAHSNLEMHLLVGPVEESKSQLIVLLADKEPVLGASVSAQVLTPRGTTVLLTFHDDGLSGDGMADDGVYGAALSVDIAGLFLINAEATGLDNSSNSFDRFAQETLFYCPDSSACAH